MSTRRPEPQSPTPTHPEPPEARGGEIAVLLSRAGGVGCDRLSPEQISDVLSQPGTILWVDVKDPGPAELQRLGEEFDFHPLALEDAASHRQRPKVDEYPGYYFVVLYAPLPLQPGEPLKIVELDLFVGHNYVVCVHQGEVPALQDALDRWERTDPKLRENVGFLLHTIADAVIDAYFPIVDTVEDQLDRVELSLFRANARFDAEELLVVKRNLYTLRKAIYPLRDVFNLFLRRDNFLFSPETYPYFQDVYDHVLRLLDMIDIERDMASSALEAQLGVISNRLNETMKRLTVVAICLAILGAVFGAWGMNFPAVPFSHFGHAGFWIVTAGALALTGAFLLWARRQGLW